MAPRYFFQLISTVLYSVLCTGPQYRLHVHCFTGLQAALPGTIFWRLVSEDPVRSKKKLQLVRFVYFRVHSVLGVRVYLQAPASVGVVCACVRRMKIICNQPQEHET